LLDEVYFPSSHYACYGRALTRYRDLDVALNPQSAIRNPQSDEWRIHFHIPLHCAPTPLFSTTSDHLLGGMTRSPRSIALLTHRDGNLHVGSVPGRNEEPQRGDQLVAEYATLANCATAGLA